ncbi:Carboxypeptidase [Rhynchospora pubera]|uniref:Carboxypeptidase n=1 Tax=Rhynchospora pubera TaxID=906938 RepID=A0AAV8C4J6_9POAL|nr:Carboxypeptidase [Rhynchospora pubera]
MIATVPLCTLCKALCYGSITCYLSLFSTLLSSPSLFPISKNIPMASPSVKPNFLFLSLITFLSVIPSKEAELTQLKDSDRVNFLPGQPKTPQISQFSGYITVNEANGRALFYWFFEAQSFPNEKPLLLWLNGGPGCSSIGYGAAVELGPLRVKTNGTGLEFNRYAWNQEANLLFLESPVGVGFSYTNTSSDYTKIDDAFVAEDAYNFLVNWLKRFPQYKSLDLYISGESYAGHYVPQLAELVNDRNNVKRSSYPYINLKGFMVGNPLTDNYYDSKGLVEYAWSHSVVSDQVYSQANKVCNFRLSNWSSDCDNVVNTVYNDYKDIDIYNIYAPKCNLPQASSVANNGDGFEKLSARETLWRLRMLAGYDPCYSVYAEQYFNNPDVQKSLHASVRGGDGKWKVCNNSILNAYNFSVLSVLPIYSKLINAGLRIWVYSGDADGRVPVIGTRYCVESFDLPIKTSWTPWYHNMQVAGRLVEYEKGLTFVTIRGAGHLVPLNKPQEALVLINSFLSNKSLPTKQ